MASIQLYSVWIYHVRIYRGLELVNFVTIKNPDFLKRGNADCCIVKTYERELEIALVIQKKYRATVRVWLHMK